MLEFFNLISTIVGGYPFLFIITSLSLCFKTSILIMAILYGLRAPKLPRPWFFLLPVLIGAMFSDISWIVTLSQKLFFPNQYNHIVILITRLAWLLTVIQYQSMGLFIENLLERNFAVRFFQKIFVITSIIFCSFFSYLILFHFDAASRSSLEFKIMNITSVYLFLMISPSVIISLRKIYNSSLPKILKKQIKILIRFIVLPQLFFDFFQVFPFNYSEFFHRDNYSTIGFSTILITLVFFFSAKKVMGLRFLNFQGHVQTSTEFNFINDFKNILEQLGHATNKQELNHITGIFFKGGFHLPPNRISLHIRKLQRNQSFYDEVSTTNFRQPFIEQFIVEHEQMPQCDLATYLQKTKIVITDEIAFTNFYDDSPVCKTLSYFMEQIDADIFLPIYHKHTIIAYILVDREARTGEFYNKVERDEMVVFASYLSNIIYLLQNRNLDALIQHEKDIQEELYRKHQEINQYKESIQSFLHSSQHRKIGIIFYKNRRFIFGNQAAKELITINPNTHEGHPLSKALKSVANQVQEYKTGPTILVSDAEGNKIVLAGIPHLEENAVIITVYYPEIGDLLKNQLEQIKDPSEWDYLLYLETTHSGKLINQLIPSNSPKLLQFKIELLKLALSKKALLLDMAEQDAIATTEIIHHMSLKETLHVLKLQNPEKNSETAHKIFGLNPLFGGTQEQSLLEKLNGNGTLLIQNIHYLEPETQAHLLEFIKYGSYRPFKSEQKFTSNVRIICTTHHDLFSMAQNGKFSADLFAELKKTILSLPSLITLSEHELADLVHGFTEQAIKEQPFKNLLELTDQETARIILSRPVSLHEFKTKIEQFIVHKSKKNQIYEETQLDPAFHVTDPDLVQAARLGKKALKDPKVMALLWQKFGNQNQIATFLGVNRSSVNRRCKEYNFV